MSSNSAIVRKNLHSFNKLPFSLFLHLGSFSPPNHQEFDIYEIRSKISHKYQLIIGWLVCFLIQSNQINQRELLHMVCSSATVLVCSMHRSIHNVILCLLLFEVQLLPKAFQSI